MYLKPRYFAYLSFFLVALGGCEGCNWFDQGSRPDAAPPGSGGVGDVCMDERFCRAGLACREGRCTPAGTGVEGAVCSLTGECAAELYCGPSRRCIPAGTGEDGADCESTGECAAGLVCSIEGFGMRCRAPGDADLGDPCTVETDCLAGLSCVMAGPDRSCQNPPILEGDAGALPPLPPLWSGVECEDDGGPPVSYFRVPRGGGGDGDFFRLPYPSDVRRSSSGALDLSGFPTPGTALPINVLDRYIERAEADLDGFSTNPVIYFRFSRPYDGSSITGDVIRWVDITPGSPTYGRARGLAWLTTFGRITRYMCSDWVAFRSGHGAPLLPGTTYAMILTQGIRVAEDGAFFARDADFTAVIGDTEPADAALASAWRRYQPLRDFAADGMVDLSTVLNAAVFTTQTTEAAAPALREVIRARTAPTLEDVTLCGAGVTSPCDVDGMDEQRRCGAPSPAFHEIHARIRLPIFQEGSAPYEEPEDGGAIAYEADGSTPRVVREESVCMLLTVPTGTPPAEGFPVVVAAHGTGGSFTGPVGQGLAETWATGEVASTAVRAATISIDLPQHGARRGGSTRGPDRLVYNFLNPSAARDVWLQGAADLMGLVYFAETFSADPTSSVTGDEIRFDATRIVLYAHSQGANHAGLMLPFEPGVRAVLLSGAGGDLTESLLTKTEPVNIAAVVPIALLDPAGDGTLAVGDYHPALGLFQMYFDGIDPVNFGRRFWREPLAGDLGRELFMTYGAGDSFSPERTMAALARSAFLPHVSPIVRDAGLGAPVGAPISGNVMVNGTPRTVGLRQYTPPAGVDGHFVSTLSTEGRQDVTRFVLEALSGATPTIGRP